MSDLYTIFFFTPKKKKKNQIIMGLPLTDITHAFELKKSKAEKV